LHYLPKDHLTDEICYGATVPIGDTDMVNKICGLLKKYDIKKVRLKMGNDFEQNRRTLECVSHSIEKDGGLRVDVNGAWNIDSTLQHLPLLVSHQVSILEQPLAPDDENWGRIAEALKDQDMKLMADESVCSLQDLEKAVEDGFFGAINVRLSKCSGLHGSLKIIERIRDAGLDYQVGCQLGESGILSAAGRALCAVSSDALYYDGSYDAVVLKENITTEHVTFGHGGKANILRGSGFGVSVDRGRLRRFSEGPVAIRRRPFGGNQPEQSRHNAKSS
jgi:muconate cycloisomerase